MDDHYERCVRLENMVGILTDRHTSRSETRKMESEKYRTFSKIVVRSRSPYPSPHTLSSPPPLYTCRD